MFSVLQSGKGGQYQFRSFEDEGNMANIRSPKWLDERFKELKENREWWRPVLVDEEN